MPPPETGAPGSAVTEHVLHRVPVPGMGPEDVVVGPEGRVYTGTEDGSVLEISPDGRRIRQVGRVPGRPMGLELLPDGRLLVCDADHGLRALDPESGHLETVLDEVDGSPIVLCNNATVASDGTIYFSESSRVYPLASWKSDIAMDTRSGRLIRLRSRGGEPGWHAPEVLVTGLRFANGVTLAPDESFVLVAESGGRSLVRHWLAGPRRGQVDSFATDLPGYPDNVSTGSDGLVWVAIASPPNPVLERVLFPGPRVLRSLVARLPESVQPKPLPTTRVMSFDIDGRVVDDHSFPVDDFSFVTGVREHQGRVWLGSLHHSAVAWFDR